MGEDIISTSLERVRRLAVTKQRLAGKLPKRATKEHILAAVRDLGYVQWDPISVIAPSHVIALWSRVGDFRFSDLEDLLWKERKLFEHWTPTASIVLTEDYPLYYTLMKGYPESLTKSWGNHIPRAKKFLAAHQELRRRVLRELKSGPRRLTEFGVYVRTRRDADGWSSGNDVSNMLYHLLMSGEVMVVGHEGNQNVWGLPEEFLPAWAEREALPQKEFEQRAAQRAIKALGTASPREITLYFIRGRYQDLEGALRALQEEGEIHRVQVDERREREEVYIHDDDVDLLESLGADAWQPRTSLRAPFDNFGGSRHWLGRVFGFDYVHEQFLPKEKRKHGTFVLPILWGDRLIGRIDPEMDRENSRLLVKSVHAEPGAPGDRSVAVEISKSIERLAEFLGAKEVEYTSRVPTAWKSSLR